MKRFFYKVKRTLANINQEAKIGVSIILVALIFFGGVGLTKKWWQPDTSMNSSSNMISSSISTISSTSTTVNSEPVANELDEVVAFPYPSNATIQTYFFDVNDDLETQTKSIV